MSARTASLVLAHGGGVPEVAAAIGVPVLLVLLFVELERRARRRARAADAAPPSLGPEDDSVS